VALNTDYDLHVDIGNPDNSPLLQLTWFVQSGDTNSLRTSYFADNPNFSLAAASSMHWRLPSNYDKTTLEIAVVIRDDRGNTHWTQGSVRLAP
jgi:hypothetical protein